MRRLILFDIDGTLIRGGPAKDAFRVALMEAFGTSGAIEDHDFSGKTDPQIARELVTGAGLSPAEVERGFPALWRRYLAELEARLPGHPVDVLPGVLALLDALEASGEVALGLVTGNIAPGARLKLGSAGMADRFAVGGFGSDSEDRNELPAIAMERARRAWSREFAGDAVVIVGDTPRDVACGRHGGCRTLAVATGRFGLDELRDSRPDHLLEDLSGTERALELLLDGR
ncbi:MAG: haloacid dehalogenase-like hydrolase [Gemmatimonadetes bacterium]|nr:haloacid dehalogenase-like hydrolase [Gemmatimonadota bacterium]